MRAAAQRERRTAFSMSPASAPVQLDAAARKARGNGGVRGGADGLLGSGTAEGLAGHRHTGAGDRAAGFGKTGDEAERLTEHAIPRMRCGQEVGRRPSPVCRSSQTSQESRPLLVTIHPIVQRPLGVQVCRALSTSSGSA